MTEGDFSYWYKIDTTEVPLLYRESAAKWREIKALTRKLTQIMKKTFILLSILASLSSSYAAQSLIKNGEIKSGAISAQTWEPKGKSLAGGGEGNLLSFKNSIGKGDFTLTLDITMERLDGSAASFMLGSNHFGLDGRGETFFLEGKDFSQGKVGSHHGILQAGKEFKLVISRQADQLSFSIDGKEITSFQYPRGEIAGFGFRPHRNSVSIRNVSFDGELTKLPELNYAFACGEDGYKSYRIPSIIKTKKGTLIASCEGRVQHSGDSGNIDLVFKRSTDHGKTWSKIKTIRDFDHTAGNPCPVVDQASGRIIMVYCEMDHHEGHVMDGKSERRVYSTSSDNDGSTWSKALDITQSVNPERKYNWLAAGPGIGIQIKKGKHKGRIVIPFANSIKHAYGVHTIYSDDLGKTWNASNLIEGGCNESQLVELPDGKLMLNMRMQGGFKGYRALSSSNDGGATWGALTHDDELNDPRCQASIIGHQSGDSHYLIFSNPATGGRNGMTIKVSSNSGKTWPVKKLIYPLSSGYSNLVVTDDGHVLCLFEAGPSNYSLNGIASIRIPLKELKIK